jgi:hypothetical protein
MKFRIALIMITCGIISHAFAQNQTGQSKTAGKSVYIVPCSDTIEYYASPYGKNIISAAYTGGKKPFINFLATHMQLPGNLTVSDTSDGKATDSVYANFEIEKNGVVSGVSLVNIKSPKTDSELIRVIKQSVWIPYAVDKQPVSGGYGMRIYFVSK